MEPEKKVQFLQCQLFALVALESTMATNQLNDKAQEACTNAMSVAATAIDKLVAEDPALEKLAQGLIAEFEVPTTVVAVPEEAANGQA